MKIRCFLGFHSWYYMKTVRIISETGDTTWFQKFVPAEDYFSPTKDAEEKICLRCHKKQNGARSPVDIFRRVPSKYTRDDLKEDIYPTGRMNL